MTSPLWTKSDWTFDDISRVYDAVEDIALKELNLNLYPNQIEIISSEQMLNVYTSTGMPVYYNHWSFGKQFIREQQNYQSGASGLAFEIVINSNPCVNYLMEDNTMTTQALVIAHAAAGHNHFFKNNYLFKQWSDASSIVDYLIFAKEYISAQETKYGRKVVEDWIDSCHAMQEYGVHRYKRPSKLNLDKEREKQRDRAEYLQSQVNEFYRIIPESKSKDSEQKERFFQPEENLLYFFEKYSPEIDTWKREILRIVRKMTQYFLPQGQTKVMNEGFASLTHYEIMNRLHEKGLTTDGAQLEFLALHSNVLHQPTFDSKYYNGLNPYALGFAMLRDIQRMCATPTDEDLRWFPSIKNSKGWDIILDSVAEFRDESFIRQWLSPKVIRDFKLFSVLDNKSDTEKYDVKSIHNERGYSELREKLADQYLRTAQVPHLEAINVDRKTRTLYIQYQEHRGRKLGNTDKMMTHLEKLWGGYPVVISNENGTILAKTHNVY